MVEFSSKSDDTLGSFLKADDNFSSRLSASQKNTNFVRFLKLLLPIVAIGLVVVLLVWSDQTKIAPPIDKQTIAPNDMGQNKLINPKFESKDTKAQPYLITASEAVQNPETPDIVGLINPTGSIDLNDGSVIKVQSKQGSFNQTQEILNLNDTVILNSSEGFEVQLQSVIIDLVKRISSSSDAVTVISQDGTINAVGFEGNADTGQLTFKGPATLLIQKQPIQDQKVVTP
jgi:lipopolysaccharide export system protein LptC